MDEWAGVRGLTCPVLRAPASPSLPPHSCGDCTPECVCMCVCVYTCGICVREHVQALTQRTPHVRHQSICGRSHRSEQNRQKSLLSCSRHSGLGRPSLSNLNSKFKVKNLRRESWEGEWGLQGGGRRGIVILNPVVRKASVER